MASLGTVQITKLEWAWPFKDPVDVERLGLHDYYQVKFSSFRIFWLVISSFMGKCYHLVHLSKRLRTFLIVFKIYSLCWWGHAVLFPKVLIKVLKKQKIVELLVVDLKMHISTCIILISLLLVHRLSRSVHSFFIIHLSFSTKKKIPFDGLPNLFHVLH